MAVEEKLKKLGLSLPPPAEPSFQYVPVTIHAGVAYVSGQLPKCPSGEFLNQVNQL